MLNPSRREFLKAFASFAIAAPAALVARKFTVEDIDRCVEIVNESGAATPLSMRNSNPAMAILECQCGMGLPGWPACKTCKADYKQMLRAAPPMKHTITSEELCENFGKVFDEAARPTRRGRRWWWK